MTPENKKEVGPATVFSGLPKHLGGGENQRWRKFWGRIFPWFRLKASQGERAVEAYVKLMEAEADLKSGEAIRARAEAVKVATEAIEIYSRVEKSVDQVVDIAGDFDPFQDQHVKNQLKKVEQMLETLRINYGGELLDVREPTIPEETTESS